MPSFLLEIIKELLAAWESGSRRIRTAIILATTLLTSGSLTYLLLNFRYLPFAQMGRLVALLAGVAGSLLAIVIVTLQKGKEEVKREKKIEAVEKRVQENPKETQASWELARVKLENYLNRNLSQIKSIFWLTTFVMMAGFALISVGAYEAFREPKTFNASILTTVSGVVVSFIGGTFLIIYKSTMAQAKDYVTMLERINAVGMSVQILDSLDDGDKDLKHQTIADVAKQLLLMYSVEPVRVTNIPRRRKPQKGDE
jgi:Na+/proline symporter